MPPTKKNVTLGQLRVGIFVLIAIAVLIFLVLNASGDINPFSKKLHVERGLRTRMACARVGSASGRCASRQGGADRLLEPSAAPNALRVEAQMVIDSVIDGQPANQRIRTDSQAQQGSPSLLGNEMLINITPGSSVGQPIRRCDTALLLRRTRLTTLQPPNRAGPTTQ